MSGFTTSYHKERQIQLVRITDDMRLASPQAGPLIDFLCQALVAPAQPYAALVIVKPEETDLARLGLARQLASEMLYEQLFSRLALLRRLCHDISSSSRPWIFINHGAVFDGWYELAVSCTQSFFTRSDAPVGFRDLAFGVIPPLGVFEQYLARKDQLGHDWLAQPVIRARDAVLRGGVTAIIEGLSADADDGTTAHFVADILERRRQRESTKVRVPRPLNQLPPSFQLTRPMPSPTEAAQARATVDALKTQGLGIEKVLTAIREKDVLLSKDRRSQILLAHTARGMLQPSYQAALHAGVRRGGSPVAWHDWYGEKVYVDVDQLVPPERVLERFFQQKIHIVFHAKTADGLAKAMTLLDSRFERSFSQKQAAHYWERFSYWAVMPTSPSSGLAVQWLRDDAIVFSSAGRQIKVLSLEGNRGAARPGWVEWLGALPADDERRHLRALAEAVYLGIFDPIPGLHGMPVSFLLRSIALEALARVGQPEGFHAQRLVEALNHQGWRFLGDGDGIDRFLAGRHFTPWGFKELSAYFPVTEDVTKAHSLRALKTLKTQSITGLPPLDRNQVLVSEHFAFLGYGLVSFIRERGFIEDEALAERVVGESLGFPSGLGTPLLFAQNKGMPRAHLYVKAYWPHLFAAKTSL